MQLHQRPVRSGQLPFSANIVLHELRRGNELFRSSFQRMRTYLRTLSIQYASTEPNKCTSVMRATLSTWAGAIFSAVPFDVRFVSSGQEHWNARNISNVIIEDFAGPPELRESVYLLVWGSCSKWGIRKRWIQRSQTGRPKHTINSLEMRKHVPTSPKVNINYSILTNFKVSRVYMKNI